LTTNASAKAMARRVPNVRAMETARGVKVRAMATVPAGPARRAKVIVRVLMALRGKALVRMAHHVKANVLAPMVLHAKALGLTVRGAKGKAPARVVHRVKCIAASSTSSRLLRISMRPACPTRLLPCEPRLAAWLKNRAWALATVLVRMVRHAKAIVPGPTVLPAKAIVPVVKARRVKVTVPVPMDLHAKVIVLVPMALAKVALGRLTNCVR
jgi:hypothetical protein